MDVLRWSRAFHKVQDTFFLVLGGPTGLCSASSTRSEPSYSASYSTPRREKLKPNMASTAVVSSARRLAVLRRSSSRFVASQTLGTSPACAVSSSAISRAVFAPPSRPTTSVFSRNSSTKSKPSGSSEVAAAGSSNAPAPADQDHLALAKPLDFDMASKVEGQESQMVTFELEPDQVIRVSQRR